MASQHIISGPEVTAIDTSLGKSLYQSLVNHGNNIAMVDALTGETRTFSDILTRSLSVAECLHIRGVTIGDVVGICSENNLDFILPVLASYYIGATCAPLNPYYTTRELLHAVNISKPRIIFCSDGALKSVDEISHQVGFLKEIVTFGFPLSHKHTPFISFVRDKSRSFQLPDVNDLNITAAIQCSSGTTGLPKGVMLTQRNILSILQAANDPRFTITKPGDVLLALLPMFHSYAFICQLISTTHGSKVVVMNKFEEELFLRSIQNHKITTLMLVPSLVVFLAKAKIVDEYDLSSVQHVFSGAAPLSKESETLLKKRLRVQSIKQAYGMTETTLVVTLPPPNGNKSGSSGILVAGVKCKVVDLETGRNLGPNKKGELCFKGPQIMKGYCGNAQETSAIFDADGFLHTGDVGYYDDDGFFYIVDRVKELIKYKGYQVPPAELEAVLINHPAVKDAGVIGVPDEAAGELPLAFVVKQPGARVTEDEIIKYMAGQVSPQKRLRGGVLFVDSIPKTNSGKILRKELRSMLKSKL